MEKINIYCDESCHLEHDNSDIMLLGGMACKKSLVHKISREIRDLKIKHGLSRDFEIKWTKVSPSKLDFYLDLLSLFIYEPLEFRCVVAKGKKSLNNEAFNQTYDEWYYKMYYLLLREMLDPTNEYSVFLDIKDTQGGSKVKKLKTILNNFLYDFQQTCLKNIQIVRSEEVELLQLCDLLIGCIGYYNRFLANQDANTGISNAKVKMCQQLIALTRHSLNLNSPKSESKFNLFIWGPRK